MGYSRNLISVTWLSAMNGNSIVIGNDGLTASRLSAAKLPLRTKEIVPFH